VVRWSGGQVVRWSGGQVVRWELTATQTKVYLGSLWSKPTLLTTQKFARLY
jgi:hypothetical protein